MLMWSLFLRILVSVRVDHNLRVQRLWATWLTMTVGVEKMKKVVSGKWEGIVGDGCGKDDFTLVVEGG